MGRNNDLTGILLLLGLGYFILQSRKVTEAIGAARRTTTYYPTMLSPFWITPETWRGIPGPALRNGLTLIEEDTGEDEPPSPGIPGPALRNGRNGRNGLVTQIRGGAQARRVWELSKKGLPIPGPAAQPRWPIKIGPRRVKPPMAPGLETQLRGGAHGRLLPEPETPSFAGGEERE